MQLVAPKPFFLQPEEWRFLHEVNPPFGQPTRNVALNCKYAPRAGRVPPACTAHSAA